MIKSKTSSSQIFGLSGAVLGSIILILTVIVPATASADQNDPKLDDLFKALQTSPSETKATKLEIEIWARWINHPDDPLANQQMAKGIKLMNLKDFLPLNMILEHVCECNLKLQLYYLFAN